jgi:hypothetical protein
MKFTANYVVMCQKSREVQELWQPQIGDWCFAGAGIKIRSFSLKSGIFTETRWVCDYEAEIKQARIAIISDLNYVGKSYHAMIGITDEMAVLAQGETDGGGFYYLISDLIWLPLQEQLQEIIRTWTMESDPEIASVFGKYCFPDFPIDGIVGGVFSSFEELWMAFVMEKKFNKKWDSKKNDWVVINSEVKA